MHLKIAFTCLLCSLFFFSSEAQIRDSFPWLKREGFIMAKPARMNLELTVRGNQLSANRGFKFTPPSSGIYRDSLLWLVPADFNVGRGKLTASLSSGVRSGKTSIDSRKRATVYTVRCSNTNADISVKGGTINLPRGCSVNPRARGKVVKYIVVPEY